MREGFEQQLAINITPISEVVIPKGKRDHIANLMTALQHLYATPEWSKKVEALLREIFNKGKNATGRPGMGLWEIFVLAQLRLCMNIDYDELLHMANFNTLVRGVMGVLPNDYTVGLQYSRQGIAGNVSRLDDEALRGINDIVVEMGHQVFKKKETEALRLKTDSFVVESDTYFPTDYRLLYDSGRKCLELISKLSDKHSLSGWREWKSEIKKLKGGARTLGRASSSGGKGKRKRTLNACEAYLEGARRLSAKVCVFQTIQAPSLPADLPTIAVLFEIDWFQAMLDKHIGLLERRVIKGETIPHEEKIFSIFLPFAEWIKKGKMRPPIEIGKKLFVTSDQYDLIVDYYQGEKISDSEAIIDIIDRIYNKYEKIASWSTDKGFSSVDNKALIGEIYPEMTLVMPKKGKRNKKEEAEEKSRTFIKLKNAHNAIESNINELEHRGLDRCPSRSPMQFSRYIGLAVTAYNLHKIGRELISIEIAKEKRRKKKLVQAA